MNTDQDDKESLEKPSSSVGAGVAIGMCIGVALGAALDNVGLGIALGLAVGAAIGAAHDQQRKTEKWWTYEPPAAASRLRCADKLIHATTVINDVEFSIIVFGKRGNAERRVEKFLANCALLT